MSMNRTVMFDEVKPATAGECGKVVPVLTITPVTENKQLVNIVRVAHQTTYFVSYFAGSRYTQNSAWLVFSCEFRMYLPIIGGDITLLGPGCGTGKCSNDVCLLYTLFLDSL
jgi:hypothetical protein